MFPRRACFRRKWSYRAPQRGGRTKEGRCCWARSQAPKTAFVEATARRRHHRADHEPLIGAPPAGTSYGAQAVEAKASTAGRRGVGGWGRLGPPPDAIVTSATVASAASLRHRYLCCQSPPRLPCAPTSCAGCRQPPSRHTPPPPPHIVTARERLALARSGVEASDPPTRKPDPAAAASDALPPPHVIGLSFARRPAFHAQRRGAIESWPRRRHPGWPHGTLVAHSGGGEGRERRRKWRWGR
uniref:Uncharacterized protein n=1 Tax=Oryza sativa subsp. japonica TaxID=39947 RepID=Q69RG1_ORYSJ|nr:hypothetical protein [Oryza sativa Japonica Group]